MSRQDTNRATNIMGTRHTYRFIETYTWYSGDEVEVQSEELMLLYGQYDGYPNGVPSQVAKFIADGTMVNGYGAKNDSIVFNGAGCMVAQIVAHLKDGVGTYYIQSLSSRGKSGEDYLYDIIVDHNEHTITMVAYENNDEPKEFFRGTPKEFLQKYNEEVFATFN
jgi:hypothetical protein